MATGLSMDLLKLSVKPRAPAPKPVSEATSNQSKIIVSASAAQAIKAELARRPTTHAKSGFRVGVKAGGCSGLSYTMQWEDSPRPDDKIAEKDGALVYCDPKSHVFLAGTELDYVRTLMKTGFEFKNPQLKSTCGCGESFAI